MEHPGKSVAWGRWAITNNDPEFRGKGASDSGDDYGPAPGKVLKCSAAVPQQTMRCWNPLLCWNLARACQSIAAQLACQLHAWVFFSCCRPAGSLLEQKLAHVSL